MAFLSLEIRDFRNLVAVTLAPSQRLNLIVGENASGKTSVLEACYFLGHGRSFRTRHGEKLIREGAEHCRVVATLAAEGNLAQTVAGIERWRAKMQARLGGEPVRSLSALASRLPMLVINPDSHHLLDAGPQYRRRFLDWGVFHVEPRYLGAWQRYRQVLRQRNAALRTRQSALAVSAWDRELLESADRVHRLRTAYLDSFGALAGATVERLLGAAPVDFHYLPGWPQKGTLAQALELGLERDRAQGYTHHGPHRADLAIRWETHPAAERVSRGQQKQLAIALLLAQGRHFTEATGRSCCYLVDDLAAELDRGHRNRVMEELAQMDAQVLVTAIDAGMLSTGDWSDHRVFHVEHGAIREVV
ncbi:MAG: DNA replication/repair protein RecF [Gammaproteobacteria bacterium]